MFDKQKVMDLFQKTGAIFSKDRLYRFALWRIWDDTKPVVMFIGLNPSKADAENDDPTINRVKSIAHYNGYGGIYMTNCFAYISTNPDHLIDCSPESEEWIRNDNVIEIISRTEGLKDVVFAWGNFKIVTDKQRDKQLSKMFPNAKALFINKNGSPKHPLYCSKNSPLIPYERSK